MLRLILVFILAGCASVAPRNNDIGAQYLGARYVLDPLGEGTGYDPDPLIRNDAFDCTTFVETVLANGDVDALRKIRYRDGVVDFVARNHFIETDWLQNNAELVENVSAEYGNTRTRNVTIDKQSWMKKVHNIDVAIAPQSVAVRYIPYSDLHQIKNTDPLIVLFIVDDAKMIDKIGTDIAVVHMGFLMPGGRVLRHASTGRGVVDDDFIQYAHSRASNPRNIGIVLLEIKK